MVHVILARMHSSSDIMQGQLDFSSIYVIGQLYASCTVHTSKIRAHPLVLPWLDDFDVPSLWFIVNEQMVIIVGWRIRWFVRQVRSISGIVILGGRVIGFGVSSESLIV